MYQLIPCPPIARALFPNTCIRQNWQMCRCQCPRSIPRQPIAPAFFRNTIAAVLCRDHCGSSTVRSGEGRGYRVR